MGLRRRDVEVGNLENENRAGLEVWGLLKGSERNGAVELDH
jgi:hypothetical protein